MFDLIAKDHRRTPHGDALPMIVSLGLHSVAGVMLVVIPLMVYDVLPAPPSMMSAFAAAPPPPPPPPPPPEAAPKPVVDLNPAAAPVEAPKEIAPEPPPDTSFDRAGGAEGMSGGVIAGVAGLEAVPPPQASPPPAPELGPVRIGGAIKQPALLSRVGPVYPMMAVQSKVEGIVILEAIVDHEGRVEGVKLLRPIPLLNMAAIEAVRQWRYAPLLVNGQPARFIVTVTVAFQLTPEAPRSS